MLENNNSNEFLKKEDELRYHNENNYNYNFN